MTEKRRCADCPFAAKTVPNGDMYECVAPTPVEDTYRTYYGLFLGGLEEIQQERPCRCYFQDWHTDTVLKEHLWFSQKTIEALLAPTGAYRATRKGNDIFWQDEFEGELYQGCIDLENGKQYGALLNIPGF